MSNREFSSSVQFDATLENLRTNNGILKCAICKNRLVDREEFHFDHIKPWSIGGLSSLENCQILCAKCNEKKLNKQNQDFINQQRAKDIVLNHQNNNLSSSYQLTQTQLNKESFDEIILDFIQRKGSITKADFGREYNGLPSITYVYKFYGNLSTMKKELKIPQQDPWDKNNILIALTEYLSQNGDISQKDLTSKNGLPSIPCVLKHYPEYRTWSEIKKHLLKQEGYKYWTKNEAIDAGKLFLKGHKCLRECDLHSGNNLPSYTTINSLFGNIENYQLAIGLEITRKNKPISITDVHKAVATFFSKQEKYEIENYNSFFREFKYSQSAIKRIYGSMENFCLQEHIVVINQKKSRYSRSEVEKLIKEYVQNNHDIPKRNELVRCGLPSADVITKYYEDYRQPFEMFRRYKEI